MTLQEIRTGLLCGFHDAELDQLSVDYAASTIFMRFKLWIGVPSDDETISERYAHANLFLKGMQYCAVEKPEDNGNGHLPSHFHSTVVVDFETPTQPDIAANLPGLERGHFAYSFFVHGWNCFIHVAAQSAELVFDDPADRAYNDAEMKRLRANSK